MPSAKWVRLSGLAAIAASVLLLGMFAVAALRRNNELPEAASALVMLAWGALFLLGLAGLLVQANAGRAGIVGLALSVIGVVSMVAGLAVLGLLQIEAGWGLGMLGMLLVPVGLLIYGVAAVTRHALPRWNAAPLVAGLLAGPVALALELIEELRGIHWTQQADLGFIMWGIAMGLGGLLLGNILWSLEGERPARAEAAM